MLRKEEVERLVGDLETNIVMNRIHWHFCRPLKARGLCHYPDCGGCQSYINSVFARLKDSKDIKDMYALLVWTLIDEREKLIERSHEDSAEDDLSNPFKDVLDKLFT